MKTKVNSSILVLSIILIIALSGLAVADLASPKQVTMPSAGSILPQSSAVAGSDSQADPSISVNSPYGIAVNPSTGLTYVSSKTGNSLTVINDANNQIVTTISLPPGSSPEGVAVNTGTNRVYVALFSSNSVEVINGQNYKVVTTISLSNGPTGVAVNSATNTVYVIEGGSISIISGGSSKVTGTIPISAAYFGHGDMAVNPSTNMLYVAVTGWRTGAILAISTISNAVVATIKLGLAPDGVAVNSVTNKVYVTDYELNTVSVISGATNTIAASVVIGRGPVGIAVDSTTDKIYAVNSRTNSVSVIDGLTNLVLLTLAAGSNPLYIAVNPTTNFLYVSNYQSSSVSILGGL